MWVAEPGSEALGPQQAADRDMGTPSAGTEGPLTFGAPALQDKPRQEHPGTWAHLNGQCCACPAEVASLRAAASAAVAECTKIVDGAGFEASGRQSSGRPAGADGLIASSGTRKGSLSPRAGAKSHTGHRRSGSRGPDPKAAGPGAAGAQGRPDPARAGSEASTESLPGAVASQACPPHGAKAICGRRPRMEDAYTAIPFLLEVLVPADVLGQTTDILPPRIATHVKSANTSPTSSVSDQDPPEQQQQRPKAEDVHVDSGMSVSTTVSGAGSEQTAAGGKPSSSYVETLHFFGVFDGHGGAEGALHCAQTLHQRIVEAVMQHTGGAGGEVCTWLHLPPPSSACMQSACACSLCGGCRLHARPQQLAIGSVLCRMHPSRLDDKVCSCAACTPIPLCDKVGSCAARTPAHTGWQGLAAVLHALQPAG